MRENPARIQEKGLFALDVHFRCVWDVKQQVGEVWGGVIWELSSLKEQPKPKEHHAIAHGKHIGWDTTAKAEPEKSLTFEGQRNLRRNNQS